MQTYYSALPLMPSGSLLSKKYSAISRPSLKLSESSYSRIINHTQVELPEFWFCSTSCDDIIALSLREGGIAFFDARTGNEIGSRIPTPDRDRYLIAFSPDGRWIVIQGVEKCALDLWNVETRTHVKTCTYSKTIHYPFELIIYSVDGEKVMVTWRVDAFFSLDRRVLIWDVKTGKPSKQLEVQAGDVAISPDGSQIAINDNSELGIKIIDVSTGHIDQQITLCNDSRWTSGDPIPRIAWSPNGQFLACSSRKQSRTKLYLLSLTSGSAQVPILTRLECPTSTTKYVFQLTFSPDSSKVVAVFRDYKKSRATLSICQWCTRSGALVEISYEMATGIEALSFAADGQDILICNRDPFKCNSTLYRFSVVPTHLETYMNDPPKFHPSQTPHTIQYSCHISGVIDDYASHVAIDGWIFNTKGEREIWTPWASYELLCSCKPPQKGRTQYRTLEVKDPQTKTVVMIYVIAFDQEDVK